MAARTAASGAATRARILDASLRLFNEEGAAAITTNHIADEVDISPGNLYYHFRSKAHIVQALVAQFEEASDPLLDTQSVRLSSIEDFWLYLHLAFENNARYCFLLRDFDYLFTRVPNVTVRLQRLVGRAVTMARTVCDQLVAVKVMIANREEIDAIALNIVFVATRWSGFANLLPPPMSVASAQPARAAYQVLTLVQPFVIGPSQRHLRELARAYIEAK
jgi:AcrR family transcriptional regulator